MTQETFLLHIFYIALTVVVAFAVGFIKGSSVKGLPKFENPPPPPLTERVLKNNQEMPPPTTPRDSIEKPPAAVKQNDYSVQEIIELVTTAINKCRERELIKGNQIIVIFTHRVFTMLRDSGITEINGCEIKSAVYHGVQLGKGNFILTYDVFVELKSMNKGLSHSDLVSDISSTFPL